MSVVVADASPLFYLATIGRLSWLKTIYESILAPVIVWNEVLAGGRYQPHILPALQNAVEEGWLTVVAPENEYSGEGLDAGESQAIQLAREKRADWLLIDELAGRAVAQRMGLPITGTLGILLRAKHLGIIPLVSPFLQLLERDTNFRLSQALKSEVLRRAGE